MYSRQAENHSQGQARVKGPPFKQASEEVERLWGIASEWQDASKIEAVREDAELAVRAKHALEACFNDISELHGKVDSLYKKAIEPDPELQTYGPAMKEKVLNLHKRYTELKEWSEKLKQNMQEIFLVAKEADEQKKRQRILEEQQMREEEEARQIREKQIEEEMKAKRLQEEEEKKQREEKEKQQYLEHARAKLLEAEERERSTVKGEVTATSSTSAADGWVTDPILEGGEELTLEMAIELQEQSEAKRSSLRDACQRVLTSNGPKLALEAGWTLLVYLQNILKDPRSRETRRIPMDNKVFHEKIGALVAGHDVMLALGFEEEVEEKDETGSQAPRRFYAMKKVYIDDLRNAVNDLQAGQVELKKPV